MRQVCSVEASTVDWLVVERFFRKTRRVGGACDDVTNGRIALRAPVPHTAAPCACCPALRTAAQQRREGNQLYNPFDVAGLTCLIIYRIDAFESLKFLTVILSNA